MLFCFVIQRLDIRLSKIKIVVLVCLITTNLYCTLPLINFFLYCTYFNDFVGSLGFYVCCFQILQDLQNSKRNRGFAFIEYYNHACAEFSRKSMSTAKFKLDSNTPTVSWADQKSAESTSQVSKLTEIVMIYILSGMLQTCTELLIHWLVSLLYRSKQFMLRICPRI